MLSGEEVMPIEGYTREQESKQREREEQNHEKHKRDQVHCRRFAGIYVRCVATAGRLPCCAGTASNNTSATTGVARSKTSAITRSQTSAQPIPHPQTSLEVAR